MASRATSCGSSAPPPRKLEGHFALEEDPMAVRQARVGISSPAASIGLCGDEARSLLGDLL